MPRHPARARYLAAVAAVACGLSLPTTAASDEPTTPSPAARSFPLRARGDEPNASSKRPGGLPPSGLTLAVLILATAGVAGWVVKRGLPAARGTSESPIQVIARASVAPRQGVVLLRVGSERLMLGVGGQGPPSLLARWPEASETEERPS